MSISRKVLWLIEHCILLVPHNTWYIKVSRLKKGINETRQIIKIGLKNNSSANNCKHLKSVFSFSYSPSYLTFGDKRGLLEARAIQCRKPEPVVGQ